MKISDFLSDKLYVLLTALIICLLLTMFLLSLHISASVLALLMIFYCRSPSCAWNTPAARAITKASMTR